MSDLVNLVGRLRAFDAGRALRAASHLQVVIQPHALVIAPLAMAGEDTTIHALAVGPIGGPPQIRVVPDPRVREEQYALIAWLGGIIETYYQRCRLDGDFPQIWVSSGAAAGHLDILADRLRFTRDNPPIERVGELLTYATERSPVAGQQALMTATGALSAHYCTGQQEGEDEHLGAFLAWLDPPADGDIRRAVEQAEREAMGVKTDPVFDRERLQPLVSAYDRARREGASATQLQRRARAIENELVPIVDRIYGAVQRALTFLQGQFPVAGMLDDLARREADEFESFMRGRDNDVALPYRDRPKAAAFKISERERAAQNVEQGALYGDAMAQARARLAGRIVSGRVLNVTATKVPNKTIHRFDVETAQTNLHLRQGDQLACLFDQRLRCAVEGVRRQGAVTLVAFVITAGMRAVGAPTPGAAIEMAPPPPDWNQLYRERGKMSARLAVTPWTHSQDAVAPLAAAIARPANLLAAVEALR